MRGMGRHIVRFRRVSVSRRTGIVARLPVIDWPSGGVIASLRARQPTGPNLQRNISRSGKSKRSSKNRVSEVGGQPGRHGKLCGTTIDEERSYSVPRRGQGESTLAATVAFWPRQQAVERKSGEGGIRTLGLVAKTPVFETGPIGRSGTSPAVHVGHIMFSQSNRVRSCRQRRARPTGTGVAGARR